MPGKRLVLFGAGMTGRGQVAQLAFEDGWELTLVDRDADLVKLLQHAGKYKVRLLGAETRDVLLQGYRALHTKQTEPLAEAVGEADLVITSVLEPNLCEVAKSLALALTPRLAAPEPRPLHVIAAENMMSSSTVLGRHTRKLIPEAHLEAFDRTVAFPDSMIARVVPVAADPLLILCEEYNEWTADRSAALGEPPQLAGLEWVTNQTARLQRKLYIHNTGHAVCGYLGWLAGLRYIHEAALEPRIMGRIRAAVAESGEAITREHGFDREEVRLYEEGLLTRLVITLLPDELRRVIRQPIRKLGQEERLVGPLMLCEKYGLPCADLSYAIAAVLRSRMSDDEQYVRMAEAADRLGPVAALKELVDYEPSAQAAEQIEQAYQELSHG